MSVMKFYKMHGAGNDYIYFDCMSQSISDPEALSRRLSDRHFGIGGDGIILLCPSDTANIKMRIFNADGSEGKMCGNGIRCLAYLAKKLGYVKGNKCTVETLSGIKGVEFISENVLRVDMGAPELGPQKIPSTFTGNRAVGVPLQVAGGTYSVTLVNMGNPHCVVFEPCENLDLERIGPEFEFNPAFPDRINTEFIEVTGKNQLKMRVWERGSGETFACGTGACAAAVAAVLNGYCEKGKEICVSLRGGLLKINYGDSVYMTGEATLVYTGEIQI